MRLGREYPNMYPCEKAALRVSNVSESEEQITKAAEQALPLSVGPSRKGVPGRPPGLPKTGGKRKGTPNKTPLLAQAIANRHSPDAVDYLVGVMQGKRQLPGNAVAQPIPALSQRGTAVPIAQALHHRLHLLPVIDLNRVGKTRPQFTQFQIFLNL